MLFSTPNKQNFNKKVRKMAVTLYTKPSCVQCNASKTHLDSKGVEYNIIDLSENPDALATVKELGYLQAPVIVTEDDHWSGYRPDKIEEFAQRAAVAA